MKVALTIVTALSLAANTAAAQAHDPDKKVTDGGVKVAGWTGRIDPQSAAQGNTIADAKFFSMDKGLHVTSGPAAIYWNKANANAGNYTVQATFTQTKPAAHPEGYGLVLAGRDLDKPSQSYVYFLVRQDGKFLINHRANDTTVHKIVEWTANNAVKPADASGKTTNALSIVVGKETLSFRVNGTEVKSLSRSVIDSGNGHAGTAGVAGIRVNHNLDVHIDGFSVTPTK